METCDGDDANAVYPCIHVLHVPLVIEISLNYFFERSINKNKKKMLYRFLLKYNNDKRVTSTHLEYYS